MARKSSKTKDSPEEPKSGMPNPPGRVVIEGVWPMIDGGAFAIKRTAGESVRVGADLFADGHEVIRGVVKWRAIGASDWNEQTLEPLVNDRWEGEFRCAELGRYEYTIEGWVDRFGGWREGLRKKADAGLSVENELAEGAILVSESAQRAGGDAADWLRERSREIGGAGPVAKRIEQALDPALAAAMAQWPDRSGSTVFEIKHTRGASYLPLWVERERARFGAWYEMFPRSASADAGRHGTLRDTEARLPYIAAMGFDVLYLPPIHPIGLAHRKGRNNSLEFSAADPGSPWGIGGAAGGHTALHPELGTLNDFDRLVAQAAKLGIEIALDIAFQCSPDHPWVKQHPDWFRHRPDGTIQYAENPPKKYQDIYPLDFETRDWQALWEALRDVFLFWLGHGVRIFRVDNPHTKPFAFWDWVIAEVHARDPGVIFLSEAFTRPKLMKRLAKGGYTQSYSYFTWRNDKHGLTEYFTELTRTECAEYMRPNLFANTPDILHEFLQVGGRPAFVIRLVLAATLGASYGIYGPPFELCVGTPLRPGSEEYLDSEKYQIRHWNLDDSISIRDVISRVNAIRREHRALQFDHGLRFLTIDNDRLLAFAKQSPNHADAVVVIVNLDPQSAHGGWLTLPLDDLGIAGGDSANYQVHDLLNGPTYFWSGPTNFIHLDPRVTPAHILSVGDLKTERDYDLDR